MGCCFGTGDELVDEAVDVVPVFIDSVFFEGLLLVKASLEKVKV